MASANRPARVALAALISLMALVAVPTIAVTSAHAAIVDGTCLASITQSYVPPATEPLPPTPGPQSIATGAGTITTCVVFDRGATTTGTLTYQLHGNLTCTSSKNITGTLDINWKDGNHSHANVTGLLSSLGSIGGAAGLSATITSGRFTAATMVIANLRNPLALVTCLTTGLAKTTGTTSLTIIGK